MLAPESYTQDNAGVVGRFDGTVFPGGDSGSSGVDTRNGELALTADQLMSPVRGTAPIQPPVLSREATRTPLRLGTLIANTEPEELAASPIVVTSAGRQTISLPAVIANEGTSQIRFIHNVDDPVLVDIQVDGLPMAAQVAYQMISDYLQVRSGDRVVTLYVAGTDSLVLEQIVRLQPGESYTVVVHGSKDQPNILCLRDDTACPDNARLRLVHAAVSVTPVSLWVNSFPLFTEVIYGQTGRPYYLDVGTGITQLVLSYNGRGIGPIVLDLTPNLVVTLIVSGGTVSPVSVLISRDRAICA